MFVPTSRYWICSLPVETGILAPSRICVPGRARRSSAFTENEYGKLTIFFSPSYSVKTTCTRSGVVGATWSFGGSLGLGFSWGAAASAPQKVKVSTSEKSPFFMVLFPSVEFSSFHPHRDVLLRESVFVFGKRLDAELRPFHRRNLQRLNFHRRAGRRTNQRFGEIAPRPQNGGILLQSCVFLRRDQDFNRYRMC